jgi:leader peptidase (prepilin peptidase) / N-methyltransferase
VPDTYWLVCSSILGALVGSFLNVVAYRLPLKISLVYPGSRCPSCKTPLGPTENIPILGWLLLRGRCKHCAVNISPRYPLVELWTASLFAGTTYVFGLTWLTPALWVLVSLLTALSLIDFDTLELPHELTLPGIYLGILFQATLVFSTRPLSGLFESLLGYGAAVLLLDGVAWLGRSYLWFKSDPPRPRFWDWQPFAALVVLAIGYGLGDRGLANGWAGMFAVYGLILLGWDSFFIMREWLMPTVAEEADDLIAFGGGDVLLGGLLGTWLGWQGLLVAIAMGFVLGAGYGLTLRITGRLQALERFAFGPFLALGGVISLFFGPWIINSYLRFLGIV